MHRLGKAKAMTFRRTDDWTVLTGLEVQIHRGGRIVCSGKVDDITADGSVLRINPPNAHRRLYEKTAGYEAWAEGDTPGFLYRLSRSAAGPSPHLCWEPPASPRDSPGRASPDGMPVT
jgi:hypothetical protein